MKPTISYPVLCFLNGKLVVHTQESFKVLGAYFQDEQIFSTLENRRIKGRDGWLLDASGLYITLVYTGPKREWARPLSFLWNAVQSSYQFTVNEFITVGSLRKNIEAIPKSSLGSLGRDLNSFLISRESEVVITADLFRQWPI